MGFNYGLSIRYTVVWALARTMINGYDERRGDNTSILLTIFLGYDEINAHEDLPGPNNGLHQREDGMADMQTVFVSLNAQNFTHLRD